MLVDLNLRGSILLILGLYIGLVQSQVIILANPLNDIRAASDSAFTLDLYSMIYGPNLTFSITGSYSPSYSTTGITISQNLYPSETIPKISQSNQQEQYGGLIVDYGRHLLYTLEGNSINVWTLYSFPEVVNNTAYAVNTQGTLLSMDFFTFYAGDLTEITYYIITIEKLRNTYTFRVINCTDLTAISEVTSLSTFYVETSFIQAVFTSDNENIWGFILNPTSIDIFRFNVTGNLASDFIYNVDNTEINTNTMSPVSLAFYGDSGFYCDSVLGVFQFSISNLANNPPTFPIIQDLYAPAKLGQIASCVIDNGLLTVDTLGGTAVYILPSLDEVRLYPFNSSYVVQPTYGMVSNSDFTVGYVTTVTGRSSTVVSFRIFSASMAYVNSILLDIQLPTLLQNDVSNTNPSFLLYQDSGADDDYVILNAGKSLIVYLIEPGSMLSFPALPQAYNFTGALVANNGIFSQTFPVSVTGVSPNNTAIFPIRGLYPGEGYTTFTNYSLYVLAGNNTGFTTYIPMSNYFQGANVTYDLEVVQGLGTLDTLTVTIPPKSALVSQAPIAPSNFQDQLVVANGGLDIDLVALISGNYISVFQYSNYEHISEVNFTFNVPNFSPSKIVITTTDMTYIIVESIGIINNQFIVLWTAYAIDFTASTASQAMSYTNQNRLPSGQIYIDGNEFYSMAGSEIYVYKISAFGGIVSFALYTSISSSSIQPAFDFNPIAFTAYTSLFVFDQAKGLIKIQTINATAQTVTFYPSLLFPSATDAQLDSDFEYLLLMVKTLTSSTIYRIPIQTLASYVVQPAVHCPNPISFSLGKFFYSVLCAGTTSYYVQIFELDEDSYSSLYTEINPGTEGIFALGFYDTYGNSAGYFCNGATLNAYSIGQIGDSTWDPQCVVNCFPVPSEAFPVWARIDIEFTDDIYKPSYNLEFSLTASNIYMSMSQDIYITILNSANYISKNATYPRTANNFTAAADDISLEAGDFSSPLPLDAFSGNDIEFAFQINGTIGNIVPASETCVASTALFCLENKTYEYTTVGGFVYDFDITGDFMVVTNNTNITTYNVTGTFTEVFTEINQTILGSGASCYNVRFLPGLESFVVACTTIGTLGNTYFLAVVHPILGLCSSQMYYVSYPTVWLQVYMDASNVTWIYQFEGTTISVLTVKMTGVSGTCTCSFIPVSAITQNTLLVNTFNALSFTQLNSTTAVVGEATSGLIFINIVNSNGVTSYTLNSTYLPKSNIIQEDSTSISSVNVLSDMNTALLVTISAEVYMVSMNTMSIISHFPKLLQSSSVPSNQIPGVYEASSLLAFPVTAQGSNGIVRILNYTAAATSAVFRDRPTLTTVSSRYYSRVMFGGPQTTLLFNVGPSEVNMNDRPVHMVQVKTSPMGYIYRSSMQYNGTVALVGYSKGEQVEFPAVNYFYPQKIVPVPVIDTTSSYRSHWNRWYFWTVLAIGILVLVTSVISVYVCVSKKRERTSSTLSIGLTTLNP